MGNKLLLFELVKLNFPWRFWLTFGKPDCCGNGDVEEDVHLSIEAAAEVVEAMAVAENGREWLCVPSYVVIRMDMSSQHLWTYGGSHIMKKKKGSEIDVLSVWTWEKIIEI